ncbi:tRNA N6-adenosine threonylcarbamoyltransferase, partial [Frankliniella fusca]
MPQLWKTLKTWKTQGEKSYQGKQEKLREKLLHCNIRYQHSKVHFSALKVTGKHLEVFNSDVELLDGQVEQFYCTAYVTQSASWAVGYDGVPALRSRARRGGSEVTYSSPSPKVPGSTPSGRRKRTVQDT